VSASAEPAGYPALNPAKVGMLTFLASEAAFFATLISTYLFFLRQSLDSTPSPREVFHMPLVIASTVCLLSSSLTVHLADRALRRGSVGVCFALWALTIALGLTFLAGTAREWADLIGKWGLTISRNLFGTTYFTLVGFHALHVSIGVVSMAIVLGLLSWVCCCAGGSPPPTPSASSCCRGTGTSSTACGWSCSPWSISSAAEGGREAVMTAIQQHPPQDGPPESVEVPRPTAWPLVMSVGVVLLALGVATMLAFSVAGAVLLLIGLAGWIREMLSARGHVHEPLAEPGRRPQPVASRPGTVESIEPGRPGYRFQLPLKVRPISAGVKGGIVGGLVMPIPALLYGWLSGRGVLFPVNLLAGMVLPGMQGATVEELGKPNLTTLVLAIVIHATFSVGMGLLYGVLLPTLPENAGGPLAWGGFLMPVLWTGVSYAVMGAVNPTLRGLVSWPWFVLSQIVYGLVVGLVVVGVARNDPSRRLAGGVMGGIVGGLVMPIPALLYGWLSGHGVFFPVNLLAGMLVPSIGKDVAALGQFDGQALLIGTAVHAVLSVGFGLLYGLLVTELPPSVGGPLIWGGVLLPVLWTAFSYGFMRVINPLMERYIDWPWFIASQLVFGLAAAYVVARSEQIVLGPVGGGPPQPAAAPAPAPERRDL
jgi:heme/copper-type cytochrome/quinol oxidase subunit 3